MRGHGGQSTIRDDIFLSKDGPEDLMREKSDEEKTKTGKGEDDSDYKLLLFLDVNVRALENREQFKEGEGYKIRNSLFQKKLTSLDLNIAESN